MSVDPTHLQSLPHSVPPCAGGWEDELGPRIRKTPERNNASGAKFRVGRIGHIINLQQVFSNHKGSIWPGNNVRYPR